MEILPWSKSERITVDNVCNIDRTNCSVRCRRRAQNVFLEMSDFEGTCEVIGILKEGYVESIFA